MSLDLFINLTLFSILSDCHFIRLNLINIIFAPKITTQIDQMTYSFLEVCSHRIREILFCKSLCYLDRTFEISFLQVSSHLNIIYPSPNQQLFALISYLTKPVFHDNKLILQEEYYPLYPCLKQLISPSYFIIV
jgi:hypothetical protein